MAGNRYFDFLGGENWGSGVFAIDRYRFGDSFTQSFSPNRGSRVQLGPISTICRISASELR